jgi:hypothetical protein
MQRTEIERLRTLLGDELIVALDKEFRNRSIPLKKLANDIKREKFYHLLHASSLTAAARELNIPRSTAYIWLHQLRNRKKLN